MTDATRKPRDDEIDVAGLTHVGKVRKDNQDHFLIAQIKKRLEVHDTSISTHALSQLDERVAFLAMVADGVGGRTGGEEASRLALEEATLYLNQSLRTYNQGDARTDTFVDLLQSAALASHERVLARAREGGAPHGMATTLTLWIGVWPWFYLLQVGDSRYYLYREGTLTQVTRDQTMAQDLVDQGVLKRSDQHRSPLNNVLSSAIGAQQTTPVVTRIAAAWENVHLLCSDGLTKHVSDERIAEILRTMTTARGACEALLAEALEGGGSDNITIIVGRAERRELA
ncbi:MAG: serine/threonine-protein phosphatase [Gemmatimonadetes bacterium]|nr:serine/threonine-protein phosphatase [Gemmatimonadota bacterium]MCA9768309.1 serine/threonine-protein phosphatase [Gemmatimonadota bacterium]MCB9505595.1 serine/threonine-protein phosphatase [Gemmatimonadales bacterium]MCB9518581.1 serine/threonine-protein phosphatase [Gemmatimonadales bacterium]HRX18827.1 protein phosphatase 2C domain-containing protein [Gemmatimonadales bacterium]